MDEVLDSGLLGGIASMPVPLDLLKKLQSQLQTSLPHTSDPALVAARLQRFIAAARSPTSLLAFFDRDDTALETLLRLLGTGNRVAEQLIADPESFDLVRATSGADVPKAVLVDEIVAELDALTACGGDELAATLLLRAVIGRERLRIAYAEFVAGVPTERVAAQLTVLAEAVLESVYQFVSGRLASRYGWPRTPAGGRGRLSMIGLGPLGGGDLAYDTPLELMFLCDLCEPTDGPINLAGDEFFRAVCGQLVTLLRGEAAGGGPLFAISLAKRPLGERGPIVTTITEAHRHYQSAGRTWERVLHVKSRVVAGDPSLGDQFLDLLRPWVFLKYLQRADHEGLNTLMRKFLRRLAVNGDAAANRGDDRHGGDDGGGAITADHRDAVAPPLDPRRCVGGLDDIDAVVSLLQVLNGGDLESLRVRGTPAAIGALLAADCLTDREALLLSESRRFFKRCEDCLEVSAVGDFGSQPNDSGPTAETSLAGVAWNLGYRDAAGRGDRRLLQDAVAVTCDTTGKSIAKLLEDASAGGEEIAAESELVLDPEPEQAFVIRVLGGHAINDPLVAMNDLQRLAIEPVPFLSSRRCRHVLAAIAPPLLAEVGRTPDPRGTLKTLADVSDSLGGKAVLWELFAASPPAMSLVVRLCASSPYLTESLIRYPGMIDELIDSLILDRLPTDAWLEASSIELCRGAVDIAAVMRRFKIAAHLQIGVRDCLGKESLEATHAALAATAESILRRVAETAQRGLVEQFGDPVDPDGNPVELVIVALGKLGAKEPNYHSDLQIQFLYTGDHQTRRRVGGHRTTTSTRHFFEEVARQLLDRVGSRDSGDHGLPASGPLYELSSPFAVADDRRHAVTIDNFAARFRHGQASLEQRLALCKARAISGSVENRRRVDGLVRELILAGEWFPMVARQVNELRIATERSATGDNLKRGAGGTVDVEMITATLQLCHAKRYPDILVPGTIDALGRISAAGLIEPAIATALRENYRALREVESKLRLLDTPARHEIPTDPPSLDRLAFLMGHSDAEQIVSHCREIRFANRRLFNHLIEELSR